MLIVAVLTSALLALPAPPTAPPPSGAARATTAAASAARASHWHYPLPGPVTLGSRFDPPAQRWLPGHRGVDLLAPAGTPVTAVAAGTVVFAGVIAGVGIVSLQLRDGTRATYQPVTAVVEEAEVVSVGQTIGLLDSTLHDDGHCPSTCLHLGARRADARGGYLDPLLLLGSLRVRLVPYLR